jgi:glutaminyl-peptide cyclotransferase
MNKNWFARLPGSTQMILIMLVLAILSSVVMLIFLGTKRNSGVANQQEFNGNRAMGDVEYQLTFGSRTVGSAAHDQEVTWIVDELRKAGWDASIQETEMMAHPVRNIVARWGEGQPWVILGAHYDSRLVADQDPDPNNRSMPVPGANDGASGVAVLLELARVLPSYMDAPPGKPQGQVWLVFFDAEDNGRLPGWDWILGSRAFVENLTTASEEPDAVVIIDMIGDANLNIYEEKNSDPELTDQIWQRAEALGYGEQFIPQPRHTILDDHLPFIQAGIPAVDIIDFDYPYWHTLGDTADKVSARSLKAVGDVLINWLVIDRLGISSKIVGKN